MTSPQENDQPREKARNAASRPAMLGVTEAVTLPGAGSKGRGYDGPKLHHYPRWGLQATAIIAIALVVWACYSMITNQNMQWDIVGTYLFSPAILKGVLGTITLTIGSMAICIVVGFIVAFMGEGNAVTKAIARFYTWFFRGIPLLVQLLVWFNIALLVPTVTIGFPFMGFGTEIDTNVLVTSTTAALLGLGLHEAAYMAEIVRSGIISVPPGQTEAALTLGLKRSEALRRIVFPQMMRVIIPPTGNLMISLLKASSLVAAIGGGELLSKAQFIYGQNMAVVPLLLVATIWYLVLVSLATVGQHFLERALSNDQRERARSERMAQS